MIYLIDTPTVDDLQNDLQAHKKYHIGNCATQVTRP